MFDWFTTKDSIPMRTSSKSQSLPAQGICQGGGGGLADVEAPYWSGRVTGVPLDKAAASLGKSS